MTSPFFGLETGLSALRTQQTLVDVTNQNIANANTPGYSRQQAIVTATKPYPIPVFSASGQPGQLGTGVNVTEINRARDTFNDYQYRTQTGTQGNWDAQKNTLDQIEAVVNEPSTSGLSSSITKYFSAWHDVANSPSDASVRASMMEQGKALASSFQGTVQQYQQQQRDVDSQISLSVSDVNNYASQIANLNVQVSQVETTGLKANDLRDQRDLLVDKLSSLVKVTTSESSDGSANIYVGGHQLVDRGTAHQVGVDKTGTFAKVVWNDGGPATAVTLADGKMAGLITSRDTIIQGRIDAINAVASRMIQSVNAVHAAGVGLDGTGGVNFFTGTDAASISVNASLTANQVAAGREIASGSPPTYTHAIGDSSNAIALAQLQNSLASTAGLSAGSTAPAAVLGVDVGGAAPGKTFTYTVTAGAPPTVAVSDGTTSVNATWTMASDKPDGTAPTQNVYTLDTGSLGVRLTLSAPTGTSASTAFAGLTGKSVTSNGPSTVGDQYAQEIASIGVLSATAKGQSTNQQVLVTALSTQRQAVSGVSLDEEATHLIQFQRAYQAAARVITVIDGMLDTLINHTGVA